MMLIPIDAPRAERRSSSELVRGTERAPYAEAALTPWACGCTDDPVVCNDERCADIVPELMVELI
jgi:hypothetical protein